MLADTYMLHNSSTCEFHSPFFSPYSGFAAQVLVAQRTAHASQGWDSEGSHLGAPITGEEEEPGKSTEKTFCGK